MDDRGNNTIQSPRYIESLELKNFQLHEHSLINFHPGLNVIRGKNSCGKSAAARAIRFAAFNQPRKGVDDLIRRGRVYCSVKMVMSDGSWIIREKGKDVNSYFVSSPLLPNGQIELNSFGVSVPPEVTRALGFGPLKLAKNNDIELNFASQGEAAFMLSESDPEIARWMYSLTNLDDISSAIDGLSLDHRRSGQTIKAHAERISEIESALEAFVGLDNDVAEMQEMSVAIKKMEESTIVVSKLNGLLTKMMDLRKRAIPVKERKEQSEKELAILSDDAISGIEQSARDILHFAKINDMLDADDPKIAIVEARIRTNIKKSKVPFDLVESKANVILKLKSMENMIDSSDMTISDVKKRLEKSKKNQQEMDTAYSNAKNELFLSSETAGATCPLCGCEIEGDRVEHILEGHNG